MGPALEIMHQSVLDLSEARSALKFGCWICASIRSFQTCWHSHASRALAWTGSAGKEFLLVILCSSSGEHCLLFSLQVLIPLDVLSDPSQPAPQLSMSSPPLTFCLFTSMVAITSDMVGCVRSHLLITGPLWTQVTRFPARVSEKRWWRCREI